MRLRSLLQSLLCSSAFTFCLPAQADINIGVVTSITGPAAPLGADVKRLVDLMNTKDLRVGDQKVNLIFLDDATDPTTAVRMTQKLITERNIDALIGPNATGLALATMGVVDEKRVPMIVAAPVDVSGPQAKWSFRTSQGADLMISRLVQHMRQSDIKTIGYIGFSDAWGDILYKEMNEQAAKAGMQVVSNQRFQRTDTTVTPQVLKLLATPPDAVFIGGSGTAAALPHLALLDRGYKGPIYHIHSVANKDFLRVGGSRLNGAFVPVGALVVIEQLSGQYENEPQIREFVQTYEAAYGPDSRSIFAGYAWDSVKLLMAAMEPALKTARPGTEEFRAAVRDNLEKVNNFPGASGVFTMSPTDHVGLDERARVLSTIQDGKWVYVK